MTSPYLLADLRRDEGLRLHAYPDPLSGGEPWTCGYGSTQGVTRDTVWTQQQAENALADGVAAVLHGLDRAIPWWRKLDDIRADVLAEMGYQLGVSGLLKFKHTLAAVQAGDWQAAHDGMLASAWATQTPNRAQRLAKQMLTGTHA